jgi:hypothetical protein
MIIPGSDRLSFLMPGTLCDTTDNFGVRADQDRFPQFVDIR